MTSTGGWHPVAAHGGTSLVTNHVFLKFDLGGSWSGVAPSFLFISQFSFIFVFMLLLGGFHNPLCKTCPCLAQCS